MASNGGWILLWRKVWNSAFLQGRNKYARMIVWIWLLTHADENGKVTFGIRQISRDTGLSVSQAIRVIVYFRDYAIQEVKHETTHQFSTIYILNWHKYQRKPIHQTIHEPLNERNLSVTQPIHNKEIKKKEIKETKYATQNNEDVALGPPSSYFAENPERGSQSMKNKLDELKNQLTDKLNARKELDVTKNGS